MTFRDRRPGRLLREITLSVGALVGVFCILLAIGSVVFDLRPLIFRSGSMSPTISTGALAVAQNVPSKDLRVGDIVMVKADDGSRVTHRIVTITHRADRATLALKGDANGSPDAEVYDVARADRVWFAIPRAGYVVAWLAGPIGLFLLGAYATFLLFVLFGNRAGPKLTGGGGARKATGSAVAMIVVVGAGSSALLVSRASPTLAAWTDPVSVTGTALTAYTVPKPIVNCSITEGALAQKTATIVWTEVSSPFALDYTAIIVETGQSMTVTDNGSTRQTQFSAGLLSTVLNKTYNIRITAKLPSPNGSWVSVNANQPVTIGLLGLSLSCGTAT